MAQYEQELFDTFEYRAELGGFLLQGAPVGEVQSLRELTEGRFHMAGNAIVDSQRNRIIGNLSASRGATISRGTQGTIFLNNAVQESRLAESMGSRAIPRAMVSGDLSLLGVAAGETVNRMITLTPLGHLIYVNDAIPSGRARYTAIDAGVFGEVSPPLKNEFGRLATSEDLLKRGVAGWLSRNAPAAIDRLKQSGVTLDDGTVSTNGSDIVRAIAANITVTPILSYLLRSAV